MRKKLSNSFYVILMVALLWVASYNLLPNGIGESQKTEALDSYAETTLLDVNNNKIVDSLEKDIERDSSQKVNSSFSMMSDGAFIGRSRHPATSIIL
jgi:hypothetical protein